MSPLASWHASIVSPRCWNARDGSVVVAANQLPAPVTTRVFELGSGSPRVLFEERGSQFTSMTERGGTLWVAMDKALQAIGPGGVPRDRLMQPTIPAVGRMITDREGSLWMATPRGLVQIPEPELWSVSPSRSMSLRSMARTRHGVWGTFWGSLAYLKDEPGEPRMTESAEPHYAVLCPDAAGRVWTADPSGASMELDSDGVPKPVDGAPHWEPLGCGTGANGRRWIAGGGGELFTVTPQDRAPRRVPMSMADGSAASAVSEDAQGTLWLALGSRVCHANAAELAASRGPALSCEVIPGEREIIGLEPMPSGDIWVLTTHPASLLRRSGGRWEPIPGAQALPSHWPVAIRASPSGGVWIVGFGIAIRVVEDRRTAGRLGGQGAPHRLARLDDDQLGRHRGGRWTELCGSERTRASSRFRRRSGTAAPSRPRSRWSRRPSTGTSWTPAPPFASPTGATASRRDSPPSRTASPRRCSTARASTRTIHGPRRRRTAASSSSISHPAPTSSRSQPASTINAGPSALRVSRFRVLRPWYAEPWLIGMALVGVAGSGHLMYRLRVRRRLALERQRARIAMDLHDDVGSGLGTIAVLAGIAGTRRRASREASRRRGTHRGSLAGAGARTGGYRLVACGRRPARSTRSGTRSSIAHVPCSPRYDRGSWSTPPIPYRKSRCRWSFAAICT